MLQFACENQAKICLSHDKECGSMEDKSKLPEHDQTVENQNSQKGSELWCENRDVQGTLENVEMKTFKVVFLKYVEKLVEEERSTRKRGERVEEIRGQDRKKHEEGQGGRRERGEEKGEEGGREGEKK